MSIKEVKVREIEVPVENSDIVYFATVRDGCIIKLSEMVDKPSPFHLQAYVTFIIEVLEAVEQTEPGKQATTVKLVGDGEMSMIPTFENMIKGLDDIIKNAPPFLRESLAVMFKDTEIEKLLFESERFEEQASEHFRSIGWTEPA